MQGAGATGCAGARLVLPVHSVTEREHALEERCVHVPDRVWQLTESGGGARGEDDC